MKVAANLFRHNLDALPATLGQNMWNATATKYDRFLSNYYDPVMTAFKQAKYNPVTDDSKLELMFKGHTLRELMDPNSTSVNWNILEERNTPQMREAIADMAYALESMPSIVGFTARAKYDLRQSTYQDDPLFGVDARGNRQKSLMDEYKENFLKGPRETEHGKPGYIPYLNLFKAHMEGGAAQHAFQPFHIEGGKEVIAPNGDRKLVGGKVVLEDGSPFKQLTELANNHKADPSQRQAAQTTLNLIKGEGRTMSEGIAAAILRYHAAQKISQNLKVVGNSLFDYIGLTGVSPQYLLTGGIAAVDSPVTASILDRLNTASGGKLGSHAELKQALDSLRLKSTDDYYVNMLDPKASSEFKANNWDLMGVSEIFFRRAAAAARIQADASQQNVPLAEILEGKTQRAQDILGNAKRVVKETQGMSSEFDQLMISGTKLGAVGHLKNSSITSMGTLLGMGKRAASGDAKAAASLTWALGSRIAWSGGKALIDPRTATALLAIPAIASIPVISDFLMSSRDGTIVDLQRHGIAPIKITGIGQLIDNAVGTNVASAAPTFFDPNTMAPEFQLFFDQSRNAAKVLSPDATNAEKIDAGGAMVSAFGGVLPLADIKGVAIPLQLATRGVSALSHMIEANQQGGTREYGSGRIPVNPAAEAVSIGIGGSGPGGSTIQRRALDAQGQFSSLHHRFQDYIKTHPQQAAAGVFPNELVGDIQSFNQQYGKYKYPDTADTSRHQEMLLSDLNQKIRPAGQIDSLLDVYGQAQRAAAEGRMQDAQNLMKAVDAKMVRLKEYDPNKYGKWTDDDINEKWSNRESQ